MTLRYIPQYGPQDERDMDAETEERNARGEDEYQAMVDDELTEGEEDR